MVATNANREHSDMGDGRGSKQTNIIQIANMPQMGMREAYGNALTDRYLVLYSGGGMVD